MRRRLLLCAFAAFLLASVPSGVLADREEPMSPQALEIANDLNCPVCEGQSVRDSNAQLARDMRRTIQELLNEGYSEEEVHDYFVDRYGVGILREPPKSGFFMTLWWAPVIGIAIGALVLGTFLTQRKKPSNVSKREPATTYGGPADSNDDLSEYEQRVLQDLDDDSHGNGRR